MHRSNIIKLQLLMVCSAQTLLLHGMEMIENEYNKNLLEYVAYNLSHNDYHAQRALSSINHKFNKIVEDTYWPQKKFIEEYVEENKNKLSLVTGVRSWNKDFSKCAWLTYDGDVATLKNLQLTLVGKCDNQVTSTSAVWEGFYFPTFEDNVRPFFDEDGRACFYGYGQTRTCDGEYRSFAQYCLGDTESRYCCYFYYYRDLNDMESYCGQGLQVLLQYPILVKAFLQSKKVIVSHCCNKYDRVNNFYITGVTIPENYKFFKKSAGLEQMERKNYVRDYSTYTSYDSLKPELRKAIDDQYAQQQDEKNNQNSQEK